MGGSFEIELRVTPLKFHVIIVNMKIKNRFWKKGIKNRGDRIRTCDLGVPNAALYQAEPRPVSMCYAD